MMKKTTLGLMALTLGLGFSDIQPGSGIEGWSPVKEANAIVGRPATPGSWAGVARRTTRRVIIATSIYVASLPPNCTTVVIEGTTLHQCGGTYYQASGTQYVVVNVE
jgi:hypothetical protein